MFSFKDPFAKVICADIDDNDPHSVEQFVHTYFTDDQAKLSLANVYTILTDFASGFGDDFNPEKYRYNLMNDKNFEKKIAAAENFFSNSISTHIRQHESSADIWWEMIQQLMRDCSAPEIKRSMFIDDVPNDTDIEQYNHIVVVRPDRSTYTVNPFDLLEDDLPEDDLHKQTVTVIDTEPALTRFANTYIRENYDSLTKIFDELVRSSLIENDFAAFLKDIHECTEVAMSLAFMKIEDDCDPILTYKREKNL